MFDNKCLHIFCNHVKQTRSLVNMLKTTGLYVLKWLLWWGVLLCVFAMIKYVSERKDNLYERHHFPGSSWGWYFLNLPSSSALHPCRVVQGRETGLGKWNQGAERCRAWVSMFLRTIQHFGSSRSDGKPSVTRGFFFFFLRVYSRCIMIQIEATC